MIGYNFEGKEERNQQYCKTHPRELVIGVCAICLKDRLLILLASSSKKGHSCRGRRSTSSSKSNHIYVLQKVSALGAFLRRSNSTMNQLQFDSMTNEEEKEEEVDDESTPSSQEDSFISIKFGEDGCASWDKDNINPPNKAPSIDYLKKFKFTSKQEIMDNNQLMVPARKSTSKSRRLVMKNSSSNCVVEHGKGPRGSGVLRWRKRVGQVLFQLVRLKRSTIESSSCHVSGDGKVKALKSRNKGWIKTLTKKRDHQTCMK